MEDVEEVNGGDVAEITINDETADNEEEVEMVEGQAKAANGEDANNVIDLEASAEEVEEVIDVESEIGSDMEEDEDLPIAEDEFSMFALPDEKTVVSEMFDIMLKRRLMVYPVQMNELTHPTLLDCISKCIQFKTDYILSAGTPEKPQANSWVGLIEIVFKSTFAAKEAVDDLKGMREDLTVRFLDSGESMKKLTREWKSAYRPASSRAVECMIYVMFPPKREKIAKVTKQAEGEETKDGEAAKEEGTKEEQAGEVQMQTGGEEGREDKVKDGEVAPEAKDEIQYEDLRELFTECTDIRFTSHKSRRGAYVIYEDDAALQAALDKYPSGKVVVKNTTLRVQRYKNPPNMPSGVMRLVKRYRMFRQVDKLTRCLANKHMSFTPFIRTKIKNTIDHCTTLLERDNSARLVIGLPQHSMRDLRRYKSLRDAVPPEALWAPENDDETSTAFSGVLSRRQENKRAMDRSKRSKGSVGGGSDKKGRSDLPQHDRRRDRDWGGRRGSWRDNAEGPHGVPSLMSMPLDVLPGPGFRPQINPVLKVQELAAQIAELTTCMGLTPPGGRPRGDGFPMRGGGKMRGRGRFGPPMGGHMDFDEEEGWSRGGGGGGGGGRWERRGGKKGGWGDDYNRLGGMGDGGYERGFNKRSRPDQSPVERPAGAKHQASAGGGESETVEQGSSDPPREKFPRKQEPVPGGAFSASTPSRPTGVQRVISETSSSGVVSTQWKPLSQQHTSVHQETSVSRGGMYQKRGGGGRGGSNVGGGGGYGMGSQGMGGFNQGWVAGSSQQGGGMGDSHIGGGYDYTPQQWAAPSSLQQPWGAPTPKPQQQPQQGQQPWGSAANSWTQPTGSSTGWTSQPYNYSSGW